MNFKRINLLFVGRNRQTPWGGCTDANPKLLLNDTCLPPKLVPLHYES